MGGSAMTIRELLETIRWERVEVEWVEFDYYLIHTVVDGVLYMYSSRQKLEGLPKGKGIKMVITK